MTTYSIYVIDDEESLASAVAAALNNTYEARAFFTAEDGLAAVKESSPDLILLDIGLPGMSGIEALTEIKKIDPQIMVIMITAFEETQTVVTAMRSGAHDYVVKPIDMETLEVTIHNALQSIRLRKEVQALQEECLKENLPFIVGKSKAIESAINIVTKVAISPDTPVLILGESGTGKELLAKAVHYHSPLYQGAMITVNSAALPKELVESELFGYEPGAFSGALPGGKKGMVEEAHGGTLFLDEIGDLNLDAQAKLLRFLESGEFCRLGSTQKRHVKTRIITATNQNLEKMIADGEFREDLYYRIGVVTIEVPSLNERSDDIVPIAEFFISEFSNKFAKTFSGLTEEAKTILASHYYRGNIRELKNIIERAVLFADGPYLEAEDLGILKPNSAARMENMPAIPPAGLDLPSQLNNIQKNYIEAALIRCSGNETKAAELLNINYSTLRYQRRKYNIP